jgi:hypothetical protein
VSSLSFNLISFRPFLSCAVIPLLFLCSCPPCLCRSKKEEVSSWRLSFSTGVKPIATCSGQSGNFLDMPFNRIFRAVKSEILLQILFVASLLFTHVCTTTCTDALLASGYPTCFNNCASICELYCPDASNTTCECTTPAYAKAIFDCVRGDCDASDYKQTENLAILGCSEVGIDVAPQISAMDASASATAVGATATSFSTRASGNGVGTETSTSFATERTTAAATNYYPSAEKSRTTITASEIIGIIIGALSLLSIIGSVIWFVWAMQKRKAQANPNQGRGAVTMVAPPYQPPTDPTPKLEPVVQYTPHPGSDMYPTAITQTPGDMYPTVVNNMQPQYQQAPMQYQQVPFPQRAVSPLQQHPPFSPFPVTELANSYPRTELPSSFQVVELPHPAPQSHVELPGGFDKS